MLTPQAIKDQEFQIKFRGCDAIEVKSYLELLAEDFFELLEQNRVQAEEIQSFVAEQKLFRIEKKKFENELQVNQVSRDKIRVEIAEEYSQKDEENGELKKQIEVLQTTVNQLEDENAVFREKISDLEEKLGSGNDAIAKERDEIKRLHNKLEQIEERNRALEKDGVDFKTTIVAAQKFADNLRENSEHDALLIIEQAKAEVEEIRNEAREELAHIPRKIEELQQKKNQVRNELKVILNKYLQGLDTIAEDDIDTKEDDLSDLFQSIQLSDTEDLDQDNNSTNPGKQE